MGRSGDSAILIVDDEAHIRRSLGDFLALRGHRVTGAASGRDALEILRADPSFLIVFTDIRMPEMDGIELLHEIKRLSPAIEVVMITGSRNVDTAIRAMREGAFDYFRKPFLLDEVALTIDRVVEKKRLLRAALELEVVREKARVERRATMEATFGLAQAVEEKDPYTKGHSERVAKLAVELGRHLGFSEEKLERLRITGLLHDVGKIAVPQEILTKRESLTPSEFLLVKRHPEIGARILTPISYLKDIIPGIRHHHENHDGSGYPLGLRGPEIPTEAMIIKVCDCFDAVTSDRPYRRPMSPEQGIELLRREAGGTLDPRITRTFIRILVEGREALRAMLAATP